MKFKKVYIEITNKCNLHCSFCPPTVRREETMEISAFEQILDKLKGYTQYLHFHVKGEPLLHPKIDDFFNLCYEKGFKVNITTNGTLIEKLMSQIKKETSLRQVSISLQSMVDQNGLDAILYMDRIFDFIERAVKNSDMFIELRLWNLKDGITGESKNHWVLKKIEEHFFLENSLEQTIQRGKGIKIANRVFLSQASKFEWPDINKEVIGINGYCYGLKTHFAILVDGTVVPCCLDSEGIIDMGNIYKVKDLDQILDTRRVNAIRDGFANRIAIEPLCQRCGYRTRF